MIFDILFGSDKKAEKEKKTILTYKDTRFHGFDIQLVTYTDNSETYFISYNGMLCRKCRKNEDPYNWVRKNGRKEKEKFYRGL